MRTLTRLVGPCAALLTLFFAGSVAAMSFDYSYEFKDGTVAAGTLAGDIDEVNSNLVAVTSVSFLTLNGEMICSSDCAVESAFVGGSTSLFPVVSLDGVFVNMAITPALNTSIGVSLSHEMGTLYAFDGQSGGDATLISGNWSLTPAAGVPEPGAAMLFGAGVLVAASRVRRETSR